MWNGKRHSNSKQKEQQTSSEQAKCKSAEGLEKHLVQEHNNQPKRKKMTRTHVVIKRRTHVIKRLQTQIGLLNKLIMINFVAGEDVNDELFLAIMMKEKLKKVLTTRFYRKGRIRYRQGEAEKHFAADLDASEGSWLNDTEFKKKYAMTRESFWKLHQMIKNHPVFQKKRRGRPQLASQYQLLVLLAVLRTEGDGMSDNKARNTFRLSVGCIGNCRKGFQQQLLTHYFLIRRSRTA